MKWCLIALAAAALLSTFVGYRFASYSHNVDVLKSTQRAIAQANEQAAQDAEIIASHAMSQAEASQKTRIITRTVTRHVASNPVFTDCTLDPIGLCLARAAARGESGADCTARPDAGMPSARIAGERDNGRTAGELHRDGGQAAQLQGAAQGAGGLE